MEAAAQGSGTSHTELEGRTMAKANVSFKVVAADGLRYWLAIDEQDLQVVNGQAVARLERGMEHVLIWWMIGDAGDSLSIEGKDGERVVVAVKESKIPPGATKAAGYRRFEVAA